MLDALCRALRPPFHEVIRRNLAGIEPAICVRTWPDFDFGAFLGGLQPASHASRRATPSGWSIRSPRPTRTERVDDGLPETLEEVVATYGHRWFKLKVGRRHRRRRANG